MKLLDYSLKIILLIIFSMINMAIISTSKLLMTGILEYCNLVYLSDDTRYNMIIVLTKM